MGKQHTFDAIYSSKNRYLWFLLAFQGGLINVAGLLAVHRFVAHVSGFSALFAIDFYQGKVEQAMGLLLVPLFYLSGSIYSAYYTERRRAMGRVPIYVYIMITLSFLFTSMAFAGLLGLFGDFGEPLLLKRDFVLLGLLCFCAGAQNALFTRYSKSVIRTTHLTGMFTDLGIDIVKYFTYQSKTKKRMERQIIKLRVGIIVSFFIGSVFAVYLFKNCNYYGFFVPSFISIYIGIKLFQERRDFELMGKASI